MITIAEQQRFTGSRPDRVAERRRSRSEIREKTLQEKQNASGWPVYDSSLEETRAHSFAASFKSVLPEEFRDRQWPMKEYIHDLFQEKKENSEPLLAIEVGGPGSVVFLGFEEGYFEKTAGITLADGRTTQDSWRDEKRNHSVIEGDLQTEKVKRAVDKWRGDRKIDLVFERMSGGLALLPRDPYHLAKEFSHWYDLLNEGGVMFVQIPVIMEPVLAEWEQKVREETGGTIETSSSNDSDGDWWVMRLNKHPGAPEKLPLLTFREVRTIYEAHAVSQVLEPVAV